MSLWVLPSGPVKTVLRSLINALLFQKTSGPFSDWNLGNTVNAESPPLWVGRIYANLVWKRLSWMIFAGLGTRDPRVSEPHPANLLLIPRNEIVKEVIMMN